MQQGPQGIQQMPPGMQQMPPGMQQMPPGMQQMPPGMHHGQPGMQQMPQGMQQMPPGMQQMPPGMQQGQQGIQQMPPGMQQRPQGPEGMQQMSPGMQQRPQGPEGMQQIPPGMQQGPPGMQQGSQGVPVSHPGLPPGHPLQNHPGFPRHLLPGMMQQRPEHGFPMRQRAGFPQMERMQGMMNRTPMLPHWAAPRQEYPMAGSHPRRGPRPSLPSMNALARTRMPHLSMRQGVPHSQGGPFPGVPGSIPPTSEEGSQAMAVGQEDPSQATIAAGIPRSSPETSSVQTPGAGSSSSMQVSSGTETVDGGTVSADGKGQSPGASQSQVANTISDQASGVASSGSNTDKQDVNSAESTSEPQTGSQSDKKEGVQGETTQECTDGKHCGTPPPQECTDGKHCGTPPPQECTDGKHCGTPPPQECTDGKHCGTPPPQECTDGKHCGTPPPQECTDGKHCGTPPPQECTDGKHCGTPPPQECADGKHCGTPPPQECADGKHCGTPPPQECTDGKHCGTPPPQECTDGKHCGTPPPQECTDGKHCGTPPPRECADGKHCGTPPPQECTDGKHCGTPPPQECTDGIHCGTPPPQECTDGIHCGTPPPQECTDGIHCGTPPPQECSDGKHCGTPPPQECSDGKHCGTPPPQEYTDGIHCGTPPPQECTDGIHCGTPPPQECTDGIHCGTPPPQECADGKHCGTPPPQECADGKHCGTPPPQECADGKHCGTPPPQECSDGKHCGTPPPQESSTNEPEASTSQHPPVSQPPPVQPSSLTASSSSSNQSLTVVTTHDAPPSLQPVLLSPQQLAVQADHQYVNVSQPPVLLPSHSTEQEKMDIATATTSVSLQSSQTETLMKHSQQVVSNAPEKMDIDAIEKSAIAPEIEMDDVKKQGDPGLENPDRKSPTVPGKVLPCGEMVKTATPTADGVNQETTMAAKQPESVSQSHQSQQETVVMQHLDKVQQVNETAKDENETVPPPPIVEDVKDKVQPQGPVTEPVTSLPQSVSQESVGPSQPPSNATAMEVDQTESNNNSENKTESHTSVRNDSSQTQAAVKPNTEEIKSQMDAAVPKVKEGETEEKQKTPVTDVAINDSQGASSSEAKSIPSAAEIEASSKQPTVSEIKTEGQAVPPVSISAAHLSSIPRPRYFAPVSSIEEMQKQMFPGHMPDRPPFPGPGSARYPGHMPDTRQQGYPPGTQPSGQQQRQPQPAHFHESQLRFMQMYQHQLAQGQRPQAAHQSMQQFPPGQHPYPDPHGFRGPGPGPGFPHFYPQHPNIPLARQRLPVSTQPVPVSDHVAASRSKSTSPNDQNLQRMPLSAQPGPAGQMRHPGPATTLDSGPRPQGMPEQAPQVSSEQGTAPPTSTVSPEEAARISSPAATSETTSAQSTAAPPSSHSSVLPTVGAPEQAIKHLAPGAVSEHDPRFPHQVPTSGMPMGQMRPNIPPEFAARFQGQHRFPYPGFHPEYAMRYQFPPAGSKPTTRPPGPWTHTEVRVRYPGPGMPPDTRLRHPALLSESPARQPMPPEFLARHPVPSSMSESAIPPVNTGSSSRQSSPASTSGGVDNSQSLPKSNAVVSGDTGVVVKEEPMDYQQTSCTMSNTSKPSQHGAPTTSQQQDSQAAAEGASTSTTTPVSSTATSESVAVPRSGTESQPPATVQIKTEPGGPDVTAADSSVSFPSSSQPSSETPSSSSSTTTTSVPSVSGSEPQTHVSSIPRPHSGHRQSPGHSQASDAELTLPSVSATFAAAGMMRYGESMQPGLPPYPQGHYRLHHPGGPMSSAHGPGFSSVSSIVQSVSSVTFPNLSGTHAQHHMPSSVPPAEVSLPPSTGVSSEAVSSVGASASTQTPVHHKVGPHPGMVPEHSTASSAATEQTPGDARPRSAGSATPTSQEPRPGQPYSEAQGPPGAPSMPGPHGPRMPVPPHSGGPMPTSQPGHVPRPRGPRQPRQSHDPNQAAMSRFPPRVPSNLPPHLAGMLNNMRGPMPPARHMFPQERHPGMPPMRFPPGQGMMQMGPGGYRMPVSQDGTPMPMTSEAQMQMQMGAARHPGMMPQGMVMRPGMRMVGPGGPMMGPHPMQPPHPGPISPSGHPGAPPTHMHQRMAHPTTASGPLMGPPGMPQPSGHPSPKESMSPNQGMPPRPPTPGSVPSTPSPTPFPPGMMPMTSAPTMPPGLPGEMHMRHRFPGHRMRMPFDGRMPFDANMAMGPRMPGMEGAQRPPGFPPDADGQIPGMPQIRPGHPGPSESPVGPAEKADIKPGPVPTPPQPGSKSATPPVGSETNSASTTPPTPGITIKQEQNIGRACFEITIMFVM